MDIIFNQEALGKRANDTSRTLSRYVRAHISQGTGTITVVILLAGNSKSTKPTQHLIVGITGAHSYTYSLRQPLKRSTYVLIWKDL